jgi:hypothetical protein
MLVGFFSITFSGPNFSQLTKFLDKAVPGQPAIVLGKRS